MSELAEVIAPLAIFGFLGAEIIVPQILKHKERERMQELIRMSYERGQGLPPELAQGMMQVQETIRQSQLPEPGRDLRRGVVFLMIAAALITAGTIHSFYDGVANGWFWFAGATFPGFIGLGYILIHLFLRKP